MKVAIMSRWNATCGVSLHAELIGREFVRRGIDVIVFAPTLESAEKDWHHRKLDVEDEEWVIRCYEETDEFPDGGRISVEEVLGHDYDVFIVEGYERLPVKKLGEIFPEIKKRAHTVLVLHVGTPEQAREYLKLDFDAITVFDERFVRELLAPYMDRLRGRVHIVPYPCAVIEDYKPYRPEFATDKTLFFTFGRQPVEEYRDYIAALDIIAKRYDIVYWVIRSDGLLPFNKPWLVQWRKRPPMNEIYSYLSAADVHLIPKGNTKKVVLSSTLYQTLAAYTPTVVPDTRYFEDIPTDENGIGPVVKYRPGDVEDLVKKLTALIEDENLRNRVIEEAKKFVEEHRVEKIVDMFLALIHKLETAPTLHLLAKVRAVKKI